MEFQSRQEPGSKKVLRTLLGYLPFEMRITGRRRDLGIQVMDRLFWPSARGNGLPALERVDTRDGHRFLVDCNALNERLLSYYYDNLLRHYRASPLNTLLEQVAIEQPGIRTFLDVGGNLGFYSLLAREAGYKTVVIEAEPHHAAFLMRHPSLFPRVFPVAVGDREGTAEFHVSQSANPGGSSMVAGLRPHQESLYDSSVTVKVQRLDALLEQLPDAGRSIAVIKIDVEGFEEAVVKGLTGYLDKGHRPAIWCEVRGPSSARAPDSHRKVTDCLSVYGYQPFDGETWPPGPFGSHETELPQVFDLLYRCPVREHSHSA